MSEPFIGEIRLLPYSYAPRGWALCEGQLLQIAEYNMLYAILGVTYGGDGRVTFALPNLKGRVPMHSGQGPGLTPTYAGQVQGMATVTLQESQMPAHNHVVNVTKKTKPESSSPTQNSLPHKMFNDAVVAERFYKNNPETNQYVEMGSSALSTTGSSHSHENRQPFLTASYCIALEGVFPPRS